MRGKCVNCGGKVIFSPKSRGSKCLSCGSVFPIDYVPYFGKKRFESLKDVKVDSLKGEVKAVRCSGCGVNMILTEDMVTAVCPYCGKPALSETKEGKLSQIDSIIPFEFGRKEALRKFKATIKARVFSNSKLFSKVSTDDMTGIYVNSLIFDLSANVHYSGTLSKVVTVQDDEGHNRTEVETEYVSGTYFGEVNDFPVSVDSFPNSALSEIMPFNYDGAVEFNEDFLTGYSLEYKDKLFKDSFKIAEDTLIGRAKSGILNQYGYDNIVSMDVDLDYVSKKYNYCLMPVYLYRVKKKDKKYLALQNGQTGKVGKIPKSPLKLLLLLGGCVLFVALLIILTNLL